MDRGLIAAAGLAAAGLLSIAVVWAVLHTAATSVTILAVALAAVAAATAPVLVAALRRAGRDEETSLPEAIDWTLLSTALDEGDAAAVVTDRAGHPVCANRAYQAAFPGIVGPLDLGVGAEAGERLAAVAHAAWREGQAEAEDIASDAGDLRVQVRRAGAGEDFLIWRLTHAARFDLIGSTITLVEGPIGQRLDAAGLMAAVIDGEGGVQAGNALFLRRALGDAAAEPANRAIGDLLVRDELGRIHLSAEGGEAGGPPLRLLYVPAEDGGVQGGALLVLVDQDPELETRQAASASLHGLLAMLPLGLALAERDGRFIFMNVAFERAAGVAMADGALYPSDLVVEEDKATVSDAVRRFAAGRALPGDLAVRLKAKPDEPVALTIAGATGLGDAAVLLSLKDNSEESRLKRQVAQATKMQAVGQLAGGVAHDFNNVLTAIIGHCDLMLMRHRPGDTDHDDIQQIKLNSNRAASLTRQLLAFSRQQTLRPQVLQLPDVISEVSHLLKRLLGETVSLTVKHGRNLGYVRADPGQLEQVIVNLAVNARDAMPDGGTLTLQTFMTTAADVRRMGNEILPVADYVTLTVQDTGHGIPVEIQAKIFEPFFTTKEVGKGTGLGLSTVYGIVKQTDGFIFAESAPGEGTRFVIYLPVHRPSGSVEAAPRKPAAEPTGDLWGTGTILLVEDEAMVRSVAERALSRQGYRVLTATNGEEALEVMEQSEPIDLLISDVVMPTMDGPTLVRHARARHPDLPVLFMSGYAEEQLRRSIDVEKVAFLPKPFSVLQLCTAARDTLAARKAEGAGG
ncbi:MAG: response regulator [Sphingomonas fennica]